MAAAVYLERTIISYLTGRPSRDLIVAAHQQITRQWWEQRRARFEVYVSRLVLDEARAGDAEAANRRLEVLEDLPSLEINAATTSRAMKLGKLMSIPPRARADTLHIALAAVHGVDYLLTWNCAHIANAEQRPIVEAYAEMKGSSRLSCACPTN
jgi:predicted nucleic acid-binding protein